MPRYSERRKKDKEKAPMTSIKKGRKERRVTTKGVSNAKIVQYGHSIADYVRIAS